MKQYKYNRTIWRLTGDGAVFLRDARGLFGSDPEVIEIPEVVYHRGKPLPVTGIWLNAFQGIRTAVKRLIIPKTVTTIGHGSFSCYSNVDNLGGLEEIIVDEANEVYAGVGPGLYTKDLQTLVYFPLKSTLYDTIPEQTVLDDYFFYGRDCKLMPERILKFKSSRKKDDALRDYGWGESRRLLLESFAPFADEKSNVNLLQYKGERPIDTICEIDGDWNEVTLPDTIIEIDPGAFLKANIKSINMPKHIKSIGYCAFVPWNETDTLDLPASLESVDPHAFDGADKVKHIVVPCGVKECDFMFNFINLETIEMKVSENGKTNFVVEDGVLYSADKHTLVKYLKTKTDKEFHIPDEVECVVAGAFRGNPYLERVVVPRHYIETKKVEWPLDKTDENLVEAFYDYYGHISMLPHGRACYPETWERAKRKWKNPMFDGCAVFKELVYDDGEPVYGSEFDVEAEALEALVPFSMITTKPSYFDFNLLDGVLYWNTVDDDEGNLQELYYYPIERKDEVFVIDKDTTNITELKSRHIKKLVIHNSYHKHLFRGPYELTYGTHPWSDIELPALEQIEVLGDDGCFFVENGCLFHKEGSDVHYDIGIPGKEDWGKSLNEKRLVSKLKVEVKLDGKHFYSPKYDMAVRKGSRGRIFAKVLLRAYYVNACWVEDFVDCETGEVSQITRHGPNDSCMMAMEMELPSDSCILAEFNRPAGMLPITDMLYQTFKTEWGNSNCNDFTPYDESAEVKFHAYTIRTFYEFGALAALGCKYDYSDSDFICSDHADNDYADRYYTGCYGLSDDQKKFLRKADSVKALKNLKQRVKC